jgi:hypothetical protein
LEDDEGSGIAQGLRWLRRRRGIDDRDELRKDAPVPSRTRHFALLRVSGEPLVTITTITPYYAKHYLRRLIVDARLIDADGGLPYV